MAVVKNLMIRIGADFSAARKGMQGATSELERFKRDTTRKTSDITGKKGLGGVGEGFKKLDATVKSSTSNLRGSKGISGLSAGLKNLRPVLGAAAIGMTELGIAAVGVGSALGPIGVGVTAISAALSIAAFGVYKASQAAVKFEADLGRVNMQLKGGTRDFMQWARAQGLAKSTASELGATYSVLLSSFIRDNTQLQGSTKELVQATRVVASATGRSIEDTLERMRSGLLGNTEAIEDLGIFVNVSMIESTNAFKRFANNKSWDQLDFRVQQQIRLAAILEQSYQRYGDKLQNNVMTKQTMLVEQFKDIKLNLSQAFLPIWDSVLPTLTKLTGYLATATEAVARFSYALKGWDYDARTKGMDTESSAADDLGKSYDELGDSAKKAKNELASFDQLNLIGDKGNGAGGGTGGIGNGSNAGSGNDTGGGIKLPEIPEIPPALTQKWRIEFDPPNPPDAGAGAVATSVTTTVNGLVAETKRKMSEMWDDINAKTKVGVSQQLVEWNGLSASVAGVIVPGMVSAIIADWTMLNASIMTTSDPLSAVRTDWHGTLDYMQNQLNAYRPYLSYGLQLLNADIVSIKPPLAELKTNWHGALDYMQGQINAYQPYISFGVSLVGASLSELIANAKASVNGWRSAWQEITSISTSFVQPIVSTFDSISSAYKKMMDTLGQPIKLPSIELPKFELPSIGVPDAAKPYLDAIKNLDYGKVLGDAAKDLGMFGVDAAATLAGVKGIQVGAAAGKTAIPAIKAWLESMVGRGVVIPGFASGALAYGPTLAMVGDNRGAATDPEVIAPLSKLADYMPDGSSDNREVVGVLRAILQAVKESGNNDYATISKSDLARIAENGINDKTRRSGRVGITV